MLINLFMKSSVRYISDLFNFSYQQLEGLYDKHEIREFVFILLEHLTGVTKKDILLNIHSDIPKDIVKQFFEHIDELKNFRPVQYITGKTNFYNSEFIVNKYTLIPRQETEELVELIIKDMQSMLIDDNFNIVDIGTGSGCIIISVKKSVKSIIATGVDVYSEVLEVAAKNAKLNNVEVDFINADILNKNDWYKIPESNIIVSNPPYVLDSEASFMNLNVLLYEPEKALFVSDNNPLIFYENILNFAKIKLKPSGKIFFEINETMGREVVDLCHSLGFNNVEIKSDINGKDRIVYCSRSF